MKEQLQAAGRRGVRRNPTSKLRKDRREAHARRKRGLSKSKGGKVGTGRQQQRSQSLVQGVKRGQVPRRRAVGEGRRQKSGSRKKAAGKRGSSEAIEDAIAPESVRYVYWSRTGRVTGFRSRKHCRQSYTSASAIQSFLLLPQPHPGGNVVPRDLPKPKSSSLRSQQRFGNSINPPGSKAAPTRLGWQGGNHLHGPRSRRGRNVADVPTLLRCRRQCSPNHHIALRAERPPTFQVRFRQYDETFIRPSIGSPI